MVSMNSGFGALNRGKQYAYSDDFKGFMLFWRLKSEDSNHISYLLSIMESFGENCASAVKYEF